MKESSLTYDNLLDEVEQFELDNSYGTEFSPIAKLHHSQGLSTVISRINEAPALLPLVPILPLEIWIEIFSYLSLKQLLNGPFLANKEWKNKVCSSITNLDLKNLKWASKKKYITNNWLRNCKFNLFSFDLSNCKNITDSGIKNLSSSLVELSLFGCTGLTDSALKYIPVTVKNLNLSFCKITDDGGMEILKGRCSALQSLSLFGCSDVSDIGLEGLPPTLMRLELGRNEWVSLGAPYLPQHLTSLHIFDCENITDASILHLPKNLNELVLKSCPNLTDTAIANLALVTLNLRIFWLCGSENITDSGLAHLSPLKLEDLHLSCCDRLGSAWATHLNFEDLQQCLLMKCDSMNDETLLQFSRATKLSNMRLFRCSQFTEVGVASLPDSIKTLQIRGNIISLVFFVCRCWSVCICGIGHNTSCNLHGCYTVVIEQLLENPGRTQDPSICYYRVDIFQKIVKMTNSQSQKIRNWALSPQHADSKDDPRQERRSECEQSQKAHSGVFVPPAPYVYNHKCK
eukprot:TRINITY_DN5619_c0_g3_i1.p1 TRINITY_DN5619_c0_g3~~TRINITY_DN5619_c0_g3_i1.p1  ORF type:complete len:516 (+),score=40.28 TRINITY_DN5619_c0_g3_i1:686-2233(+)